jgi:hypothetical protein
VPAKCMARHFLALHAAASAACAEAVVGSSPARPQVPSAVAVRGPRRAGLLHLWRHPVPRGGVAAGPGRSV